KKTIPKYNPLDNDTKLEDALDACATKQERDSLEDICVTQTTNSNFSISNARIDIATKTHSMPYDPANFAFSYSHSHKYSSGETTVYEKNDNWRFNVNYNYSPKSNGFQPFKSLKDKSGWLKILQDEKINYVPQNLTINSDITRTYYELQERDMNNLSDNSLPMIWSSDFLWNRSLNLTWDITNNIHASLQTGTNAEVVEPYLENNRSFYHDDYSLWKDSIMQSLKNFGKPLSYTQSFSFSWQLPINKLPAFKWVNTNMSFNSSYNWKRGTTLSNGSTNGNDISNTRDFKINGRFNLEELYNLVPYLKNTNKYYSLKTGNKKSKKDDKKPEKFEQEITLKADTTLTINHKQKNKKLRVIAIRKDGKRYPIKYKVDNNNTITILNKDTISLKLTITPAKKAEESILFKIARATTRFAMMVRNVNISYNNNFSMNLPGFLPNAGDFFGQNSTGCLKPGLDFAFGLVDEGYITKAKNSGWLLCNDSVSTPATTNLSENLQLSATLEPIPSLKIDLNAARSVTKARSIQYMYEGMPATQNGSFRMTTISISTAFESPGTQGNGFANKTFNRFLSYLDVFRTRVEAKYEGAPYPKTSQLAGETFSAAKSIENPERYGTINKYSSDVMIPAFLAAYCGGGTNSSLDIFPTLTRLLPNWKISYGGLMRISWFKHNFNKFTLDHSYKSEFNVGSYNTFNSYIKYMGELGFITNATTNLPVPSSMYDISTAAINEAFSPLFGVSATFKNGITTSLRYNKTRIVTLSMTSQQISESFTNDIVVGLQYKINDFKLFGAPKKKKKIVKRRNNKDNEEEQQNKDEEISTGTFNQTLQLKGDFSLRDQSAVNRNILTEFSQATSGNKALKISLSAEYAFSKTMTFSAFYDRQTTTPLLTASSYPTTIQDFGISMKFSLTR
ncbi:MAG: cell surface protein SprA, partial [Prevotellaceae bacterium]|nr:cell surface protein SprA [Candidatus Faecinaster equi]